MRDVLPALLGWWREGRTVALATVVGTWDSAPRPVGAAMLVGPDGSVVGSVSGGCVEADVCALAEEVLADGVPVLRRYGVSDADALAVGLPCGGTLDVHVAAVSPATFPGLDELATLVDAGEPVAVATVVAAPRPDQRGRRLVLRPDGARLAGGLGSPRVDAAVTDDARGLLAAGRDELLTYGPDGERLGEGLQVLVAVLAPRPRMLVCGASEFATALARMGAFLGYRVTVCDARARFATPARFPQADEVVVDWPHRYLAAEAAAGRLDGRTALCVLTHDPKFDVPLLAAALRLPLGYVGVMGSRRTHADRVARLRAEGLTDVELGRMASPLGLDLGARTPEETAVSIAAELVSRRWGGQGRPLSEGSGRIHHEPGGPGTAEP
ncbi:xanthine dehydrogenase accessory factor [Friedmanniella luteola]|uniref:Xanthine dehydrogenase accessory factor n=1 Tax=Friedmanniella luteola TaxID=546871 RepID=A0A1H1VBJ9_9ACTN|nr:XdhC/CoxI family protein [Friedmanniella luteola]SDS82147.1 xanthine dehydrogenase accessory factor [Friedmanniella luteola]